MARFKLTIESFLNGKSIGISGTSIEANSVSEAKQKYLSQHRPSTTRKTKIISCVKI